MGRNQSTSAVRNSSLDITHSSHHFTPTEEMTVGFPLEYRVVATIVHSLIFILGVVGNTVLIIVSRRAKSLRTSTFQYLVSLAVADLIVLISAVPEGIVGHHTGAKWFLGQAGCSLLVFFNFLGINAGSLSILAFTLEQYIVVCVRSLRRREMFRNTKRQISLLWMFSFLYCTPWLGLTEVRVDPDFPDMHSCELRLSQEAYRGVFSTDLIIFYVIPLMFAAFAYCRICAALIKSSRITTQESPSMSSEEDENALWRYTSGRVTRSNTATNICSFGRSPSKINQIKRAYVAKSRAQVVRMLVVIVICFAVAWLPYRALLLYNSFAEEYWDNMWFAFLSKSLIFGNAAMNPFLYNAMSPRFRIAVSRLLCMKHSKRKPQKTPRRLGKPLCFEQPPISANSTKIPLR